MGNLPSRKSILFLFLLYLFCFLFFLAEEWLPGLPYVGWEGLWRNPWFYSGFFNAFWKALLILIITSVLFHFFFLRQLIHFLNTSEEIRKESRNSGLSEVDGLVSMEDFWKGFYRKAEERNRQGTSLVQKISHELKTPLMIQKSYLKAWEDKMVNSEKAVDLIREQIERMEARVKQMILFSRVDSDYFSSEKKETFYLDDLCRKILDACEALKSPNQSFSLKAERIPFYADKEMWSILLENLISNQVRYAESLIWFQIKNDKENGTISLTSGNDGTLIAEEKIEAIFSPYEKDPQGGGSGLGLSIVQKIVKFSGGSIKAENTPSGPVFIAEFRSGI